MDSSEINSLTKLRYWAGLKIKEKPKLEKEIKTILTSAHKDFEDKDESEYFIVVTTIDTIEKLIESD